jgi:hypothetical protein
MTRRLESGCLLELLVILTFMLIWWASGPIHEETPPTSDMKLVRDGEYNVIVIYRNGGE